MLLKSLFKLQMERVFHHILRLTTQSKLQVHKFYSENNALKVKNIHVKH